MKTFIVIFLCITFFACRRNPNQVQNLTTSELIQTISSDSMQGRYPGTIGFDRAANFVENCMRTIEIRPFINGSYRDSLLVFDVKSYNLLGVLESKDPINEYIVLGAHLDHLGAHADPSLKGEVQTDTIYNGANDNASGVVAVLQIAKELRKYKLKKNIIIAFFTGEEYGKWGSEHLAKRLKRNNIKISYMLNFDMVGVPFTQTPKSIGMTGHYISDFAEVSDKLLKEEFILLSNDVFTDHFAFFRSDNSSFFSEYKIPSHTFVTYEGKGQFPYYHTVKDESSEINVQFMDTIIAKTSKLLVLLLESNSQITFKKSSEEPFDMLKGMNPIRH